MKLTVGAERGGVAGPHILHAAKAARCRYILAMTKRIGDACGDGGRGVERRERAHEIGANTFQIFSSSPRMWRAPKVKPKQAERMRRAAGEA